MLNVALHNCKTATANVVNGTNGPFCAITVIDEKGDSLQLYFKDWDAMEHIACILDNAADELCREIDIAAEEADKAERRSRQYIPGIKDGGVK